MTGGRTDADTLRSALDVAGVAAEVRDPIDVQEHLLPALARAVGADWAIHHQASISSLDGDYTQLDVAWPDPTALAAAMIGFGPVAGDLPTLQRIAADPSPGVVVLSALITRREWRETRVYRECLRHLDLDDQLACVVDVRHGVAHGITVNRHGRAFTAQDAVLLELLRPHLAAALRRAHDARRGYLALDVTPVPRMRWIVPDDGGPATGLTRREREILALVATGATSRRIAARLGLSVRTVDKHLGNAYRRLGVDNRVAAVARLHDPTLAAVGEPVYGDRDGASGRPRSAERAQPT